MSSQVALGNANRVLESVGELLANPAVGPHPQHEAGNHQHAQMIENLSRRRVAPSGYLQQADTMCKGGDLRHGGDDRVTIKGKKDPGEVENGSDQKRIDGLELVDVSDQRRGEKPDGAQGDGEQTGDERKEEDRLWAGQKSQDEQNQADHTAHHRRADGTPKEFPEDDFLYPDRRGEHGFEDRLIGHPDIESIAALKK